jgi:hypothetical protein
MQRWHVRGLSSSTFEPLALADAPTHLHFKKWSRSHIYKK